MNAHLCIEGTFCLTCHRRWVELMRELKLLKPSDEDVRRVYEWLTNRGVNK